MPEIPNVIHFITSPAKVYAVCGERGSQSTDHGKVTCFACRSSSAFKDTPVLLSRVMAESPEFQALDRREGHDEQLHRDQRRRWTIECIAGDTDLGFMDWLRQRLGVEAPTPLHASPCITFEPAGRGDGNFRLTSDQFTTIVALIMQEGVGIEYEIVEHDERTGIVWLWVHHLTGHPTRHWIDVNGELTLSEEAHWQPTYEEEHGDPDRAQRTTD